MGCLRIGFGTNKKFNEKLACAESCERKREDGMRNLSFNKMIEQRKIARIISDIYEMNDIPILYVDVQRTCKRLTTRKNKYEIFIILENESAQSEKKRKIAKALANGISSDLFVIDIISIDEIIDDIGILRVIKEFGPISAKEILQLISHSLMKQREIVQKSITRKLEKLRKDGFLIWTANNRGEALSGPEEKGGYALSKKGHKRVGAERSDISLDIRRALRLARGAEMNIGLAVHKDER